MADDRTPGTLYLVPTPIGNLGDITLRAIQVLGQVERVLAEDTRHTGHLLRHHGIATALTSLTEHNVAQRLPWILEELGQGHDLALVSDAGTPLVCDPGLALVQGVIRQGLRVVPLPGPSAILTALTGSGLMGDAFVFDGFLPKKASLRETRLRQLMQETRTVVFYETPHRLLDTLTLLAAMLPATRTLVVARELTKIHETFHRGSARELLDQFTATPARGEMVVVMEGAGETVTDDQQATSLLTAALQTMRVAEAVRRVAAQTGVPRARLYDQALALTGKTPGPPKC